ncbi:hypothetical protein Q9L58_005458, partial [Maublancomyces gigas]
IAGTLDLISKANTNLKEANAQIHTRNRSRQRLLDSIRGDPDRKDHADRQKKVFKWEIENLKAKVIGLEESMAVWSADLRWLKMRLRAAERDDSGVVVV